MIDINVRIEHELNTLNREYQTAYEQAGLDSDGELGVHNDYEQGREDALKEIRERILKVLGDTK